MSEDWELKFFDSGEWQVIEEKLDELDKQNILYCPKREDLFASLDSVPLSSVRSVVVGQDPYPDPSKATGIAFSVPRGTRTLPPSLLVILMEYCRDLNLPWPKTGNLEAWCKQGVLLINAIPTCLAMKPLSHQTWFEWEFLTQEVIEKCDDKGIPFVLVGGVARKFVKYIKNSPVLEVSHPSPRASINAKVPFEGCGMFSWVNKHLEVPINWRL